MNDIKHINSLRPSQGANDSNSSSSGNNQGSDINSVNQQFAALNATRAQMRGETQSVQQNVTNTNNQKSEAGNDINTAKHKIEDGTNQATESGNNALQSQNNADTLRSSATLLRAQADKTADPRKKNILLEEAKRKEVEALREEQNAQAQKMVQEDAQKSVGNQQQKLEDSNQKKSELQVQSGGATAQLKSSEMKSPQVLGSQSQLKPSVSNIVNVVAPPSGPFGTGSNAAYNSLPGYGLGPLGAIKSLLNQVMSNSLRNRATGVPHPTPMEAFHRGQSSILKLAISACDAVITNNVMAGSPLAQAANFLKLQAESILGETQAAIQYWGEMQKQNVQAEKDTFNHSKHA